MRLQGLQIDLWLFILFRLTFLKMLLFLWPRLPCVSWGFICLVSLCTLFLCGLLPFLGDHWRVGDHLIYTSGSWPMQPAAAGSSLWDRPERTVAQAELTEELTGSRSLTALRPWLPRHPEHSLLLMVLRAYDHLHLLPRRSNQKKITPTAIRSALSRAGAVSRFLTALSSIPSAAALVQAITTSASWTVKWFHLDFLSMCPSLDTVETGSWKIDIRSQCLPP